MFILGCTLWWWWWWCVCVCVQLGRDWFLNISAVSPFSESDWRQGFIQSYGSWQAQWDQQHLLRSYELDSHLCLESLSTTYVEVGMSWCSIQSGCGKEGSRRNLGCIKGFQIEWLGWWGQDKKQPWQERWWVWTWSSCFWGSCEISS